MTRFAVLAMLSLAAGMAVPLSAQRTDTTFSVGRTGTLRVDNHQGGIRVRGWDQSSIRVRASHPSRVRVDITRSNDIVRLEGEATRGPARGLEYEIDVPRGWAVRIDSHTGHIETENTGGDVIVSTVNGDIIVAGVADARLETVQGEIVVNDARGGIRASGVNRGIRVANVVGDVIAETVTGTVALENVDAARVSASTINGSIQFTGRIRDDGDYSFDTHNGDATVVIAAGANANVTVATHGGSVESDFPVQLRGDAGRMGELQFELGRGGARLRIESFNGVIRILRAGQR